MKGNQNGIVSERVTKWIGLKPVICDPAMGSAGFIVESAKYIKNHYAQELMRRENQEHYRNHMFHGFDTDQTMLRIGAMNLMLHNVDNPDIEYKDSLSTDNTDAERKSQMLERGIEVATLAAEDREQLQPVFDYEKTKNELDPNEDYERDIESKEMFSYEIQYDLTDDNVNLFLKDTGEMQPLKTITLSNNGRTATYELADDTFVGPYTTPDETPYTFTSLAGEEGYEWLCVLFVLGKKQ